MDKLALSKDMLLTCKYGIDDDEVFEIHLFVLMLTLPIAVLLLYNSNLRRFYTPLARVVNASIILTFMSVFVFFYLWNYAKDGEGSCLEIFLSRLVTIFIMIGEFHQIYVIAFSLGLGSIKISILSTSYNLESVLNLATLLVALSVMLSYFFLRDALLSIEHGWTVYVSFLQLYIINTARSERETLRDIAVVSANDSSVTIFEKFTIIQLMLASFCLFYRISTDILGFKFLGKIELTLVQLDEICTFLFYIKTLLIKERTNVNVSVV